MNIPLHPNLRKYCGIDLSQLLPNEDVEGADNLVLGHWMRNAMRLSPSTPYSSVQGSSRAKYVIMGNPRDDDNPFAWHSIWLYLSGTADYNPTLLCMIKIRKNGLIASDIALYVDGVLAQRMDTSGA